jgi:hypothetical protein
MLEDVRITGVLPIGESEDLMGLYFEWLRENYSSFDGNAGRKRNGKRSKSEGGTRYQATMGCPITEHTKCMNSRHTLAFLCNLGATCQSRVSYVREITRAFANRLFGANLLKAQKVSSVFSVVRRETLLILAYPGAENTLLNLRSWWAW